MAPARFGEKCAPRTTTGNDGVSPGTCQGRFASLRDGLRPPLTEPVRFVCGSLLNSWFWVRDKLHRRYFFYGGRGQVGSHACGSGTVSDHDPDEIPVGKPDQRRHGSGNCGQQSHRHAPRHRSSVQPTCSSERATAVTRRLALSRVVKITKAPISGLPQVALVFKRLYEGGHGRGRTADLPLFRLTALSAVQTCKNGRHRQAKPG
jgi:hypothetical protein